MKRIVHQRYWLLRAMKQLLIEWEYNDSIDWLFIVVNSSSGVKNTDLSSFWWKEDSKWRLLERLSFFSRYSWPLEDHLLFFNFSPSFFSSVRLDWSPTHTSCRLDLDELSCHPSLVVERGVVEDDEKSRPWICFELGDQLNSFLRNERREVSLVEALLNLDDCCCWRGGVLLVIEYCVPHFKTLRGGTIAEKFNYYYDDSQDE